MSLKKQYSKTKATCKVTFSLPKEAVNGGKKVQIVGDFNNWDAAKGIKMKAGKKDYAATIELTAGKQYEFRYLIDKYQWTNDWSADAYRPSPYYGIDNSVVILGVEQATKAAKPKADKKKATKAKAAAKTKKAAPKKASPKKVVLKKVSPKAKKADDLTKIEGVGPKIAGLLKAAGIKTFTELAKAKKATLTGILDDAGSRYRMHDPTTWAKQSKLAAADKWDALGKLQDQLKGGK